MTLDEIKAVYDVAASFGLGAALGALVLWLVLRSFFPAYLAKKGENLATKEDIAKITHEIESVKAPYALLLEQFKAQHSLRIVAAERRLQAHQEAYALWRRIVSEYEVPGIAVILDCEQWWDKNCIFLDPRARDAFSQAYLNVPSYRVLLRNPRYTEESAEVIESWRLIFGAGAEILRSVELPGLTPSEEADLLARREAPKGAASPESADRATSGAVTL